jgi:hypothetical protein
MSEPLAEVDAAVAQVEGLEPVACDGQGHPIEDAQACTHVRCTLKSPQREELLAQIGPLVRRAGWVMAALVARSDLYSLSWKPPKRGGDVAAAASKLAAMLRDPAARSDGAVPDRRGR